MTEIKQPDWKEIELDYRAGIKSLRQIASEQNLSDTAIRKRAKKDEWTRDLTKKIQSKAEELVRKAEVRAEVRSKNRITEKQTIEENAQAIANKLIEHRKDIPRVRNIVMNLFTELEHQSGIENAELLSQLGEIMRDEDEKGQDKRNDLYMKIISLQGRSATAKSLSESLKTLIALERQAFGLEDKEGDQDPSMSFKQISDAERAVRLSKLLQSNPNALDALLRKGNGNG